MAKISKHGGPSNAGIVRTRFGGHVDAGLTEKAAGFTDTTEATLTTAKARSEVPPVTVAADPPFDPSKLSVTEVLSLREAATDDEWELVLEAERAGRNRPGIVGK